MKQMLNKWIVLLVGLVAISAVSCSTDSAKMQRLQSQLDSLNKSAVQKQIELEDMKSFVTVMADGIELLNNPEQVLEMGKEGQAIDRNQVKKNLQTVQERIEEQKNKIAELEKKLSNAQDSETINKLNIDIAQMRRVIASLNEQLNAKNSTIQDLRTQLNNKDVSISQLQTKMKSLNEANEKLTSRVERQVKALQSQTEVLNEGYLKIGTKSELKEVGLIDGGFMKKTTVNMQKISKSKFIRVDIRNFTEVSIKSHNVKLLTPAPASSYRIKENSDGTSTFTVLNANSFWSLSNYCIIQK